MRIHNYLFSVAFLICSLPAAARPHSADTLAPQGSINLDELLRVIQFYNSPGLHCADVGEESEDGYIADAGDNHSCVNHSSDYMPADWGINIDELLRVIQFYNSLAYHTSCGTEDDYAVGPGTLEDCSEGEGEGEGEVIVDPEDLISVPSVTFVMGRTDEGDDAEFGDSTELARHNVTLSPFEIGKYEITNQQYCDILNYAHAPGRKYLRTSAGAEWSGSGDIYAGSMLYRIFQFEGADDVCPIIFVDGQFVPRTKVGLPAETVYSLANHPVVFVTWFGAAAFTNWLSEFEGLTPVYNLSVEGWTANFANNGYHLPTEAQWEYAAAWDGTKHWIYGFTSDTLSGSDRANYELPSRELVNPLGFATHPFTSPVGWFNGTNVSPNGNVATVLSVSPIGAFDMSGNVVEWCHDNVNTGAYPAVDVTDPKGGAYTGNHKVRGGAYSHQIGQLRTADRDAVQFDDAWFGGGFRIAR